MDGVPPRHRIGPATIADRGFLLDLGERVFAGLGPYRAVLEERLERGAVAWVARVGESSVGMALLSRRQLAGFVSPVYAELVAIAVCEPWRRTGIGRDLLAAAAAAARGFGAREMRLHTAASNRAARAFFAAAGYELAGADGWYPSGEAALAMRADLGVAPQSARTAR